MFKNIQSVAQPVQQVVQQAPVQVAPVAASKPVYNGTEAIAPVNGNVWKTLLKRVIELKKIKQTMILDSYEME